MFYPLYYEDISFVVKVSLLPPTLVIINRFELKSSDRHPLFTRSLKSVVSAIAAHIVEFIMRLVHLFLLGFVLSPLDAFLQGFGPRFLAPKQHHQQLLQPLPLQTQQPRTLRKGTFWTNIMCSIVDEIDSSSNTIVSVDAVNDNTLDIEPEAFVMETNGDDNVQNIGTEQSEPDSSTVLGNLVKAPTADSATEHSVFDGPTVDGLPHGHGTLTSSTGHILEGEFQAGSILHGKGAFVDTNGTLFEGEWTDGKLEGKCKITFPSGSTHEGEYHNGELNGEGTMTHFSGSKYEGSFFNGLKHGTGVFTSAEGDVYTGDWVDDLRHGQGKLKYASGDVYEGEWRDNKREGKGTSTTVAGHVYQGTYVHSKLCGEAVITYPRGDRYEGSVVDGKRHGKGKLTQSSGAVYEGEYLRGLQHGYGVLTYPTGMRYEGMWHHSKKHGQGKLISPDGRACEGEWKEDNIFNGKGYRMNNFGVSYEGTWIEGKLEGPGVVTKVNSTVEANFYRGTPHGQGKETLNTGVVYEGTYKEGKKHGNFTVFYPDGSADTAEFKNSVLHGNGTHRYLDGTKYTGQWRDGSRHGFGYKNYAKGGYYEGEWRVGFKEGKGKFVSHDNYVYEGEFRKDRLWNGRKYPLNALGSVSGYYNHSAAPRSAESTSSIHASSFAQVSPAVESRHAPLVADVRSWYKQTNSTQYLPLHGAHMVEERLQHIPRKELNEDVVSACLERMDNRRGARTNSHDKMLNFLIALQGTPGSGKSTAVVHYPDSPEYRQYHCERQSSDLPSHLRVSADLPVVSLFTFNSGMHSGPAAPGLRILYGALRGMGLVTDAQLSWDKFISLYDGFNDLTCLEAVGILREVFGTDRLILIGVDELSKSGAAAEAIATQLGAVLDADGRTDVIVTSLTPAYIESLLSGSQRPIQYIVPPALVSEISEYTVEALRVLEKVGIEATTFCGRMLLAATELAGGHPRTLERLVLFSRTDAFLTMVRNFLERQDGTGLLTALVSMSCFSDYSAVCNGKEGRELLLSFDLHGPRSELFRVMLERMECFAQNSPDRRRFRATTSLSSVLSMALELQSEDIDAMGPLAAAARQLLAGPWEIASLWERACALSRYSSIVGILRTSAHASASAVYSAEAFALSPTITGPPALYLPSDPRSTADDGLVLGRKGQKGWDFRIGCVNSRGLRCCIYEEIKISTPEDMPLCEVVARKLKFTISSHNAQRAQGVSCSVEWLEEIYFVLNFNGPEVNSLDTNKLQTDVVDYIEKKLTKTHQRDERGEWELARQFVEKHFVGHVRVLSQSDIQATTIPALFPVAKLVRDLATDDEDTHQDESEVQWQDGQGKNNLISGIMEADSTVYVCSDNIDAIQSLGVAYEGTGARSEGRPEGTSDAAAYDASTVSEGIEEGDDAVCLPE